MKIIISVDDLASHLKKFETIKQNYSQQSKYVCITAGAGLITLSATDGLVSLETAITCYVETPSTVTVTCKQLLNLLEALPAKEVELSISENKLIVKTITGEYLLPKATIEAKPKTTFKEETSISIEGKVLLEGIANTIFSASTDENKTSLCGINIQTKDTLNRFCAIDGHHLSTYEVNGEIFNPESNFLLLNKVCRLLTKLLSLQAKVSIRIGKESYSEVREDELEEVITYEAVIITFGESIIKYSLINAGTFPLYDQLIPRQFDRQVLVDRLVLIAAVENIAAIAQQKNNVVKFHISQENQEIIISCKCEDVGTSKTSVPAQVSGDDLTCAFNLTYLLGGLKSFTSSEVSFSLNMALSPVIVEPLSVQKRKLLLMPVQIRN